MASTRKARHQHRNLQHDGSRCGLRVCRLPHQPPRLCVEERQHIQARQIASRIVQEHVFQAIVNGQPIGDKAARHRLSEINTCSRPRGVNVAKRSQLPGLPIALCRFLGNRDRDEMRQLFELPARQQRNMFPKERRLPESIRRPWRWMSAVRAAVSTLRVVVKKCRRPGVQVPALGKSPLAYWKTAMNQKQCWIGCQPQQDELNVFQQLNRSRVELQRIISNDRIGRKKPPQQMLLRRHPAVNASSPSRRAPPSVRINALRAREQPSVLKAKSKKSPMANCPSIAPHLPASHALA